jgi:ATP-binding cassette, subfamily C (CFTR/MRP), member 1
MTFFPLVLNAMSDMLVALSRVSQYLTAEELEEPYKLEYKQDAALDLDGDFTWETVGKPKEEKFVRGGPGMRGRGRGRGGGGSPGGSRKDKKKKGDEKDKEKDKEKEKPEEPEEKPFMLKNMKLVVPRGAFVAIVGKVGSGKSSILQAMIGEMRKTRGQVSPIKSFFVYLLKTWIS